MARNLEWIDGMEPMGANLRYIETARLRTVDGQLEGTVVRGATSAALGRLTGVIVDPLRRRICYLVVESRNWFATRLYAMPLGTARLDRGHQALLVDVDADALCEVKLERLVPFSDRDLIDAMFAPQAA
jgi:hypothetical protein